MYRNLHNIERSSFRDGEYIGYGRGTVWRIWRGADGAFWYAEDQEGKLTTIAAPTLGVISRAIVDQITGK